MNDTTEKSSQTEEVKNGETERTKHVAVAGWTAGLTAIFIAGALINAPTWPVAFGLTAVAVMVAVVCYFILKR